jgi:hypothetical protein
MFVVVFLTFYSIYFISLFNKKNRIQIKNVNNNLDKLRQKKVKTVEEQKEFLNLKYPKRIKGKFSWNIIPEILWGIIKFVFMFQVFNRTFIYLDIQFKLWHAIVIIIIMPIIFNVILEKFKLHKQDLRIFLK